MIANLAQELNDEETLRELYLLTRRRHVDGRARQPDRVEGAAAARALRAHAWRSTVAAPTSAGPHDVEQTALVARRKKRVAELIGEPEDDAGRLVRVAARSLRRADAAARDRARTCSCRAAARGRSPSRSCIARARRSATSPSAPTTRPACLSKIAGVLVAHRIDVLQAQINTRGAARRRASSKRSTSSPRAIATAAPSPTPARWKRVEDDLARVLGGEATVEQVIEERRDKSSLPERVVPKVRTEIKVDNEVSSDFSVVDVYTQDRLGVLYTITRTLADLRARHPPVEGRHRSAPRRRRLLRARARRRQARRPSRRRGASSRSARRSAACRRAHPPTHERASCARRRPASTAATPSPRASAPSAARRTRPTASRSARLLGDLFEELFQLESRLWRSLWTLFRRPGLLDARVQRRAARLVHDAAAPVPHRQRHLLLRRQLHAAARCRAEHVSVRRLAR